MRALILLILFSGVLFSQNNEVSEEKANSFTDLLEALISGKEVRVIIDYAKCELIIDGEKIDSPEAIGGMDIKTFEYFAPMSVKNEKAFISTSENVLISHPGYGYVFNHVKLRFYDDNSVEITARYLHPVSYEIKMDETFSSFINSGENNGAVDLFVD